MKGIRILAIVAALGLTALAGAASASASVFEVPVAGSQSTTKWTGALTGKNHRLVLGPETFECSKVAFSGEMKGKSTSELTVNPELSSCAWANQAVMWVMNGCKFRFNTGAAGENPATGTIDIVGCTTPMKFTSPETGCQTEIGNQNGLGTASFTRTEVGGIQSVLVKANLKNITYTRPKCIFYESGTFSNGTYTGEWVVTPTHFATESAPATITATGSGKMFGFEPNGNLICSSYSASGSMSALGAESITLGNVSWSGCTAMGVPVTPSMGGCNLTYTASGAFQVTGTFCASSPIRIEAVRETGTCTITVGPTVALSGLALTGEGTGKARIVRTLSGHSAEGMEYTASGAGCLSAGTFTTGKKWFQNLALTSHTTGGGSEVQGLWIE